MQLIPVIDLMHGIVVRGVAGERARYLPNTSHLLNGHDPLETALAFQTQFGTDWLYIADLDGLQQGRPSMNLYEELATLGLKLTVDAGIRTVAAGESLIDLGVSEIVIAAESMEDDVQLSTLVNSFSQAQIRFSVDLKAGQLLGELAKCHSPESLIQRALSSGVQQFIVLDLASVGVAHGLSTLDLCRQIHELAPDASVWTGGGVRNLDDLIALEHAQISGALVASALHDGHLTPKDWNQFLASSAAMD